jgi:hypothetical protein
MLTYNVLDLVFAVLVAAVVVRYWKQIFVAFLVASATIFFFGLLEIVSIFWV